MFEFRLELPGIRISTELMRAEVCTDAFTYVAWYFRVFRWAWRVNWGRTHTERTILNALQIAKELKAETEELKQKLKVSEAETTRLKNEVPLNQEEITTLLSVGHRMQQLQSIYLLAEAYTFAKSHEDSRQTKLKLFEAVAGYKNGRQTKGPAV